MVYLGVDLHRKRSVVTALAEDGTVMLSRRIPGRPEDFRRIFGELEPGSISVAFEATYGWFWFADLLADAGIEAHMAHPLATKAIAAGRVKNDSVDARTLAHLLRTHLPRRPGSRHLRSASGGAWRVRAPASCACAPACSARCMAPSPITVCSRRSARSSGPPVGGSWRAWSSRRWTVAASTPPCGSSTPSPPR